MYCKKCEIKLEDGISVCPTCGTKVKLKKIIKIISISIVLLIMLIVGISLLTKNNKEKKEKEKLYNQNVEITVIPQENYITLAGFTFKLPNNLQYSNSYKYIHAATSNLNINFKMNVLSINYDSLKENHQKFVEALVKSGIQVFSYNILKFEEQEYFVIALSQDNRNYIYALTKLQDSYGIQALIETTYDDGYEKAIKSINEIIKDYEKINANLMIDNVGTIDDFLVSNINSNENISDLFKITETK